MSDYGQGPLTTEFVPPPYCNSEIGICNTSGCRDFSRDATCGTDGTPTLARACFPPGTATYDLRYAVISYSPMAACPYGWSLCYGSPRAVGCCPIGYTLSSGWQICTKTVGYSASTTVGLSCSQTVAVLATLTAASAQSSKAYVVSAHMISGALDPRVPFSPALSGTFTASTAAPLKSTIAPPSGSTNSGESGLPVGAIAGIAIAGLALVILAIVLCLLHRRKQRKRAIVQRPQSGDAGLPEHVTADMDPYAHEKPHELGAQEAPKPSTAYPVPAELQASAHTGVELDSSPRAELETSPISETQQRLPTPYSAYPLPELPSSPRIPQEMPNVTTPKTQPAYPHTDYAPPPQQHGLESPPIANERDTQVAQLEASKALLDERIARIRRLEEMEEEQASIQREIERLKRG